MSATIKGVTTKVQHLLDKINAVTGKSDATLSSSVNSLMETSGNIIEVTELPTENIIEGAVYRVLDERCYDVGLYTDDGQYVSIVMFLAALTGKPVSIINVDSLDSVENPQPSPTTWYYCRADHQLYGYNEDEGAWDAADGQDEDSIGTPGWQVAMDYVYYTRSDTEEGPIDVVAVESGMKVLYSELYGDTIQYHTVSRIPYPEDEDYEEAMSSIQASEDEGPAHLYYSKENNDLGMYHYFEETDADTGKVINSGYQWYYIHTIPRIPNPEDEDYEEAMAGIQVTEGDLPDGPVHMYYGEEDKQSATYEYVEETDPETSEVINSGYQWVNADTGFRGFIYDEVEAVEGGLYLLLSTGWEKHVRPRGMIYAAGTGTVVDVREAAHAYVIPPTAAEVTVTPTKYAQTVLPIDEDYLSQVIVNPIPDEYIIPADTITITENGTGIDVSQYATADVAVPIPDGYIQPTDTIEITENATGIDVSQYATADVAVPIPKIIEYPEEITTNGWHYASAVDADGVSKAYINIPTAKLIQEFNWTLQLTLDFSMIPSSLLGSIHWIYFNLPNSGSSDAYIGLHISDGELKAIPISDLTSRVTLYDTNGWATIGYSNIHCAAAVASKVLYDFLGTNYTDRILFSINTTPHQADPGMTWGEWVASDYNADAGIIISGTNITAEFAPSEYRICTADGTAVTTTDEIIANHAYILTAPTVSGTRSFTVYNSITDATATFSADAGMTWGEWVESDYNTAGYYVDALAPYTIKSAAGYNVLDSEGAVHRDDAITANGEYTLNVS